MAMLARIDMRREIAITCAGAGRVLRIGVEAETKLIILVMVVVVVTDSAVISW